MNGLTQIQCQFVREQINHRLRFGVPKQIVKLDNSRSLALFEPDKVLGYIRWRANEYGTQDWRFYILKTQPGGMLTKVPGVSPAARMLAGFVGTEPVRSALKAFDEVESSVIGGIETVPESYWRIFQSAGSGRRSLRKLPRHVRELERQNA